MAIRGDDYQPEKIAISPNRRVNLRPSISKVRNIPVAITYLLFIESNNLFTISVLLLSAFRKVTTLYCLGDFKNLTLNKAKLANRILSKRSRERAHFSLSHYIVFFCVPILS